MLGMIWVLTAEYCYDGYSFDDIIVCSFDWVNIQNNLLPKILNDGYDKENAGNFDCYCLCNQKLDDVTFDDFSFRRYNVNGELIPERSNF